MMLIEMDKMSAPSSRERAQRLYEKNLELENKRRRSAQARVPSDPNAWQQMRENYEAIILEDHAFSELHNIEYALWQLHYKRIEEFRAYFSAASLSSSSANSSQGVKGPARPDRITKIRLQFKTFLSEATGFYHDLITKIRAKYGLPLGYFEDSENRIVMEKDGKKSAEMKKGLVACHRCLIYLGDLARYKGMYGEGDSKNREYTAASSYYLQAASLWPCSGNPHHQLALLASYSGDMLVTIYRYFRSLAVDSPFTTARENLIVAFDKNRQSYSQLSGDAKAHAVKESSGRVTGKGRGKGEAKLATRGTGVDASPKIGASSIQETYIYFCTRFVRLNGILFTRTSLETFPEVLAAVVTDLRELLSSGQDEELNFGTDVPENALGIVRIVCILIFTVYNVNKESEGQSYAEIVQRAVLLQNALAAAFELMGYIIERCTELRDPSSSYLLPGILVFVEWLACYPDLSAGNDVDESQTNLRSEFWNRCVSFLNKLLSVVPMSIDDEEETCFNNMSRYEEGETENRHALWEDFELRGFVPLLPAHTILDFSRKHSIGSDGDKERNARVKRILSAGKALADVVKVDKKVIYFDSKAKKFVIGVEPLTADDFVLPTYSEMRGATELVQEKPADKSEMEIVQSNQHQQMEGDEDDEVIVFKPIVSETRADVVASSWAPNVGLEPALKASGGDLKFHVNSTPNPLMNLGHQTLSVPGSGMVPQHMLPVQLQTSRWLEEEISLANNFKGLGLFENGHAMKPGVQEAIGFSNHVSLPIPNQQSIGAADTNGMFYGISKALDSVLPSKIDAIASSGVVADNLAVKASALPIGSRKAPVSRPTRHLGPPPGFSHVPPKQGVESPVSDSISGNPMMDDYSWLDGYHFRSSTKGLGSNGPLNYPQSNSVQVSNNGFSPNVSFPFPGKQVHSLPLHAEKQNGWQDYQNYDLLKSHHDQQLQPQQLTAGNQQFSPLPEQFQGQSIWTGRYFV
ncbi:protein SMG7 [Vigna radiata var. radiata]|uniref:Protein SMG7 n=1 Tax=Vigna radiata var. radiata TaxID=3916 RepID=A0A1S3UT62_VIGRR|nr:protein SMG7 [Vigna radiata var. radiata]XP_022638368.1 protein SMG7 [Vigna radiata var. radiata]XP_022638370.1 protein SMG7 [Vigna radiata var. radiata]